MNNQTSLHIPAPCSEDWNKMTSTDRGRFCLSCQKQVVDFTLMSDTQILNYLSHQSGHSCGRFDKDQLNRTLIEPKISKRKSRWLAIALPFVLLFQKSFGQKTSSAKPADQEEYRQMGKPMLGAPAIIASDKKLLKKVIINGKVEDEFGNAIAAVSVMIKGTTQGMITDSIGKFSFTIEPENKIITLVASYVGYGVVEKQINPIFNDSVINLTLTTSVATLGIVTIGYVLPNNSAIAGEISVCKKVSTTEKLDSAVKKIVHSNLFSVYPNPAKKGGNISIKIKDAGSYELQLLDINSNLIKTNTMSVAANTSQSFQLPSHIASGIYYIRFINTKNRKSALEKIVIN